MDSTLMASLVLALLVFGLLASGLWVGITLMISGMVMLALFTPSPVGSLISSTLWDSSWSWALTSLPLFIWMGEILFRSDLAKEMFRGLTPLVGRMPGGLLHVNVLGCGAMAAITGSSSVTCATIGRMSVPLLREQGYPMKQVMGSLAGSGTMGLLIPPSISMIVYGVTAQQSIAKLFIAGIVPGLCLVAIYMGYIAIWSLLHPSELPRSDKRYTLKEKVVALRKLIPTFLLIFLVIGSIYGGIATPTEAAAVGVIGSLILSLVYRTLTWKNLIDGVMAAMKTSCMISFIIAAASCLSIAIAFIDLPNELAQWVSGFHLSPVALLIVLAILILFMGCFLEGISIIVLSSAVILPLVQSAGINMIWFGIFIIILIEAAQITPPVGFNLFVMQSLTGQNMLRVARATIPYFILLVALLVLIGIFPSIVTGLPNMMNQ